MRIAKNAGSKNAFLREKEEIKKAVLNQSSLKKTKTTFVLLLTVTP